ncbi:nuclear speckle splicing regulatory protein 1 [Folsomia candida]|nr:nuclear speckle splicing regulatory protein 1 [Folsomia candida]
MAHQKQYGLILSDKAKPKTDPQKKPASNVFGEDSSGDEESNVDWVKQSLKKQSHGSMQQKASMKVMKEALEDDPSVYEYDGVYDEMTKKKEASIEKKKADKKPKYIEALLKTAKQRELENELRKEREAQKEREQEGDEFADKEAFVTSSFKKKMKELRKMQDDQAYQDAIDDVTDVTKQKDMSGFYRQLYKDTVKDMPAVETRVKEEAGLSSNLPLTTVKREVSQSPDRNMRRNSEDKPKITEKSPHSNDNDSRRRKRSHSGSRERQMKRRHASPLSNKSRRDSYRERDFRERSRSRDRHVYRHERRRHYSDRRRRSRSRSRERDQDNKRRQSRSPDRHRQNHRDRNVKRDDAKDSNKDKEARSEKDKKKEDSKKVAEEPVEDDGKIKIIQKENWYDFDVEIERNVKTSFYAKRTVGKVFEEALQRYLERKSTNQVVIYK